jgi:hypothetical protein
MENNNSTKATQQQRNIVDRIWNPTPKDESLVRIFFWASIIICLILPRIFETLATNKAWNVISIAWLVLAVFIRFKVYLKWR